MNTMKPIQCSQEIIDEYNALVAQRKWRRLCFWVYLLIVAIAICGGLYSLHVLR